MPRPSAVRRKLKGNIHGERKEKRTFTLSPKSVAFLGSVAAEVHVSASEALDGIIEEKRMEAEKQRIAAQITQYYDSIGDKEVKENAIWGRFSESQFPLE